MSAGDDDPIPYAFRDPALLRRALTVPAPNRPDPDNQRLEFLGDAVLELLISEKLYNLHPDADEGRLTALRTGLVSTAAILARLPRLGTWFERGLDGLALTACHDRDKARVDAFEAVLGAAWLDGGRKAAKRFIKALYRKDEFLAESYSVSPIENPKGTLMEIAQRRGVPLPTYRVLGRQGPTHAPLFQCAVTCFGKTAEGFGPTIKRAQTEAARLLLDDLREKDSP